MTRSEIRRIVIEVLQEIQSICGRQPASISDGTCPIGDLDGFDSLSGVEATSILSSRLETDLDPTLFVSEDGKRALKIEETVDRIHELFQQEGKRQQHV